MIVDEITRDDVIAVLDHVQATCALNNDYCQSCPYADHDDHNACCIGSAPYTWNLDKIGGDNDE